jgi:hypothetical protein
VDLNSKEAMHITKQFNNVNVEIQRIQRIQNIWLYERYFYEKKKLEEKNHASPNEIQV